MSEKGALITEFISCRECRAALTSILDEYRAYASLKFVEVPPGGVYAATLQGGRFYLEEGILSALARRLCHPVRLAVISEKHEQQGFYCVTPGEEQPFRLLPSLKVLPSLKEGM